MSKLDKIKTYKISLLKQEQYLDIMPSKKTKKHKARSRQLGRKESQENK